MNGRCLRSPLTGVQRYAHEVSKRLCHLDVMTPGARVVGPIGHLWEQIVLPSRLSRRELLWSPGNTGPLTVHRQVVTIHDISPIDHPEWFSPAFAGWYGWMWPRLMRIVRLVIADSHHTRDRILGLGCISPDRVKVVHLGVDARFSPSDEGPDAPRFDLPCRRYLLALGSLEPRKNLGRLIAAWDRAVTHLPEDIWLVLAGASNPRIFSDCGLATIPARVCLPGRIPDDQLPGLYRRAMGFLYPSLYEGFGLPPLEAMASGVPVLAANRTSLPEAVGEAAVLVDPTDTEEMAIGIRRLVADESLRARLRTAGLARAARFTWDLTAEKTWSLLAAAADD
ncbi:MAG: glycosyltransferase family 4 protein [Planctomycetes bacterium]|nr:glycosyltransferase family 4 protein [Planctomycetota bacterium]